jgi:hypothetical protein
MMDERNGREPACLFGDGPASSGAWPSGPALCAESGE